MLAHPTLCVAAKLAALEANERGRGASRTFSAPQDTQRTDREPSEEMAEEDFDTSTEGFYADYQDLDAFHAAGDERHVSTPSALLAVMRESERLLAAHEHLEHVSARAVSRAGALAQRCVSCSFTFFIRLPRLKLTSVIYRHCPSDSDSRRLTRSALVFVWATGTTSNRCSGASASANWQPPRSIRSLRARTRRFTWRVPLEGLTGWRTIWCTRSLGSSLRDWRS